MITGHGSNGSIGEPSNRRSINETARVIYLYLEDLQFMAAHAWGYGNIETGGALFGTRTHGESIVVMLALGPGPHAVRGGAHFKDDPDYIMRASEFLFENYGLQYGGNHHSHHRLGLSSPSTVDSDQIRRLAIRNNYRQQVQLIIAYEDRSVRLLNRRHQSETSSKSIDSPFGKVAPIPKTSNNSEDRFPFVRIDAYYYANAQTGSYVNSRIKILKGESPIRRSLSSISPVPCIGAVEDLSFPLDRIIFDEFVAPASEQQGPRMPEALAERLGVLPEDVLVKSEVTVNDGSLTVELPLSHGHVLTLTIALEDEYPINKLLVTTHGADQSQDVVCQIAKPLASDDLPAVYRWAQRIVNGNGRNAGQSGGYGWIA